MSHWIPSAAGYKMIACDVFFSGEIKMCKFCWPSHAHTVECQSEDENIVKMGIFTVHWNYLEVIYILFHPPPQKIKFLLFKTAFNVVYLMYT